MQPSYPSRRSATPRAGRAGPVRTNPNPGRLCGGRGVSGFSRLSSYPRV